MVDQIAAPEFVDDPRPRLNDLRKWPVVLGALGLFGTLGAGIFYVTGGDGEPVLKQRKDGGQMVANAAPLPGFPTDYTQIKEPAPPPPAAEPSPPPPPDRQAG